jgi:thiol-disulfide isomerase/thioredoxin
MAFDLALLPIEQKVEESVKSPRVTVVHFWAPWCPNCRAELAGNAWSEFVDSNPDVNFIFVTIWNDSDGAKLLATNGLGTQGNFMLLLHPNGSRRRADQMNSFMGMPVTWIPTTWVFKDGKLRYALNYGELHFEILQQLVRDSSNKWTMDALKSVESRAPSMLGHESQLRPCKGIRNMSQSQP